MTPRSFVSWSFAVVSSTLLLAAPVMAGGNVAENKAVSLYGQFFTNGWGGGWTVAASTVVDGTFLPRGKRWDQGAVWWDARDGLTRSIVIELGGSFRISSVVVQADDNDGYLLYARDPASNAWSLVWRIPAVGGWGMQARPSPADDRLRHDLAAPVVTDALMIEGNMGVGDRLFSVSEVQAFGASLGADTSVHPELDQFPTGSPPYEFYLGQVGHARKKCGIVDQGRDIFDVIPVPEEWRDDPACKETAGLIDTTRCTQVCTAFQLPAARRSVTTYGYWYLHGPSSPKLRSKGKQPSPWGAGVLQARALIEQWELYNGFDLEHDLGGPPVVSPVIDGPTLFGDLEMSLTGENVGWCICEKNVHGSDCPLIPSLRNTFPTESTCQGINRRLLEGFVSTIRGHGYRAGLYTTPDFWLTVFGQGYQAPEPFALWTAGCATAPRSADEASALLRTVQQTTLGGMKTVLWQYQIEPDYNASTQDSFAGFTAQSDGTRTYYCSCGDDGLPGVCPFKRPRGLYLQADPGSLDFTAAGTASVTLENPTGEPIIVGRVAISPRNTPFSVQTDCSTLAAGATCSIEVRLTPGKPARGRAVLTITPPIAPALAVPVTACVGDGCSEPLGIHPG